MEKRESDLLEEDCFYQQCTKTTICGGFIPYGKFKSRNLSIMCCFFTIMCTALLVAIIVPLMVYSLIDSGIQEQVVIDSTSASSYESWQTNAYGSGKDDLQISYSLYYFDIQNPTEVLQGAQPIVTEVGPYVYDEYYYKFDIEWSDGGDTVQYNTQKYYIFNPEKTGAGLSENDQILLPYSTVVGFQYFLGLIPPEANAALDVFLVEELQAKEDNITALLDDMYAQVAKTRLIRNETERQILLREISAANDSVQLFFTNLTNFVEVSSPTAIMFKSILCAVPSGISPFWKTDPSSAWFGWPADPVLIGVQAILNGLYAKTGVEVPWGIAVPGAASNYTSVEDARRRRNVDVYKTGKKNRHQVGQYVRYQNMTKLRTCVSSATKYTSPYQKGTEFPACPYYQYEWTEAEAEDHGFAIPWETDYANRIEGTDATMFARPVRTDKLQVFVSDIYRAAYLGHTEDVSWYNIPVRRYNIQYKDLLNATANPENTQYYSFGPSGMLNTTKAVNTPIFVSYPHFYLGDPRLVAAVKGLSPTAEKHATYLDIEPQTGLLVQAKKRLQVNYEMTSYSLPKVEDNAPEVAQATCVQLNSTIADVNANIPGANYPYLSCDNELSQALLTCLAQPSTWKFQNDAVFFPYGWAEEGLVLPESDANDLNDLIYASDDFADSVRFWCLVIAGFCLTIILTMLIYNYVQFKERNKNYDLYRNYRYYKHDPLIDNGNNDTMSFTYNPEHGGKMVNGVPINDSGAPLINGKPNESYSFSG